MTNVGMQSPWVTTYGKIRSLFQNDPDLKISNLSGDHEGVYTFAITSANVTKLTAIEKILKNEFVFGNVTLQVKFIYDDSEDDEKITANDFKNAFNGNSIVRDVKTVKNPFGDEQTFVMFGKDVIQFYNDDLTDLYGNFNGLSEDIAREVFNKTDASINYMTDVVPSNS